MVSPVRYVKPTWRSPGRVYCLLKGGLGKIAITVRKRKATVDINKRARAPSHPMRCDAYPQAIPPAATPGQTAYSDVSQERILFRKDPFQCRQDFPDRKWLS